MHESKFFRAGVGILLIDNEGLVLAFERARQPDGWQLPQGGLDRNEDPRAAAERELTEETGLTVDDVTFIRSHPDLLAYELPPTFRSERVGRGQVQRWFAWRYQGDEARIRFDVTGEPEFTAVRRMRISELVDATMPFRRDVYRALAREFASVLA